MSYHIVFPENLIRSAELARLRNFVYIEYHTLRKAYPGGIQKAPLITLLEKHAPMGVPNFAQMPRRTEISAHETRYQFFSPDQTEDMLFTIMPDGITAPATAPCPSCGYVITPADCIGGFNLKTRAHNIIPASRFRMLFERTVQALLSDHHMSQYLDTDDERLIKRLIEIGTNTEGIVTGQGTGGQCPACEIIQGSDTLLERHALALHYAATPPHTSRPISLQPTAIYRPPSADFAIQGRTHKTHPLQTQTRPLFAFVGAQFSATAALPGGSPADLIQIISAMSSRIAQRAEEFIGSVYLGSSGVQPASPLATFLFHHNLEFIWELKRQVIACCMPAHTADAALFQHTQINPAAGVGAMKAPRHYCPDRQ